MQKLFGNRDKGLIFIVSAPAGAGKTTLIEKLTKEFPEIVRSITYTTREPRDGEVHGRDYFFVSKKEFEEEIEKNNFLEYADVFGKYYGSSKKFTDRVLSEKKHVVLVIDTQGAINLKDKLDAVYIFIAPPNIETLKNRMIKRGKDSIEVIEKRLSWAEGEMEKAKFYDYEIINDDLNVAYDALRSIFIAEEHRIKN